MEEAQGHCEIPLITSLASGDEGVFVRVGRELVIAWSQREKNSGGNKRPSVKSCMYTAVIKQEPRKVGQQCLMAEQGTVRPPLWPVPTRPTHVEPLVNATIARDDKQPP